MNRLICIGDILSADRQHTKSIGIASKYSINQGNNWLSACKEITQNKDILFGNLEAPLVTEQPSKMSETAFAGSIFFSNWLSKAGLDVVSIANNHILEHDQKGFESTIRVLKTINVKPVGVIDQNTGSNLTILKKNDVCIGFAGFNAIHDITPNNSYAKLNEDNVNKAIDGLKKKDADIICLSFHWGHEYIHIPSWDQIKLARKAIDAGADVIIGHHPHVIQPIEEYNNGIIIYSLGNFLFDMLWSKQVRSGMSVECMVNKGGVQSYKVSLVDIQKDYTPVIRENDEWLNNLLKENLERMLDLLEQGKDTYEKQYYSKLKRNRLKARLGMKKQLIMQWPSLSKDTKKQIVKEIFKKVKIVS